MYNIILWVLLSSTLRGPPPYQLVCLDAFLARLSLSFLAGHVSVHQTRVFSSARPSSLFPPVFILVPGAARIREL